MNTPVPFCERNSSEQESGPVRRIGGFHAFRIIAAITVAFILLATAFAGPPRTLVTADSQLQAAGQLHETLFVAGPSFNVRRIVYPSSHDFDSSSGIDTCLSLSVPPGDIFTLSLEWEALFPGAPDAGDLDLYIYLDSACTESALLTSSFNSNVYTGELTELTPQVRNIGAVPAVAGIRIGKRTGKGVPGQLRLKVATGAATFIEHSTGGLPLPGQEGAPVFQITGPFSIPENSPSGTAVGTVTATDAQSNPLTFFELEPAAGQTSFQVNPVTGQIIVEDPVLLDRETTDTLAYWIGVTNGTSASLTSVGISLTGVNDNAPVALSGSAATPPGVSVGITLKGADADIDPAQQLSMSIVSQPVSGTVGIPVSQDIDSAIVSYLPFPGFLGTDTFTFVVNDEQTTSTPATITVTVDDSSTPPSSPTPSAATQTPGPATPTGGPTPTPLPGQVFSPPPPGGPPVSGAPVDSISPPSVPRFLRSEARDGSVLITWQRPLSDGGAPIDGYRIFNINAATSTLILGNLMEGQVRGLVNGTSYLFQVRAYNSAGFGPGALVGPVTPVSANPAPIDVRATVHPDDTITVWWSAPIGSRLKPVVVYKLWLDGGELLKTIDPNSPLIVNVSELEGDANYSFRVTASDAVGELVATGITDPVYLPPTLAYLYEPMPFDAILVPLSETTRTELQLALRDAAGGQGIVEDSPVILTVRNGEAAVFVRVEELDRAFALPARFTVETDQLVLGSNEEGDSVFELEISHGVKIAGTSEEQIDPTGILFHLTAPELKLSYFPLEPDTTIGNFELISPVLSLAPGYLIRAESPEEVPAVAGIALLDPAVREVAGYIEVTRTGLVLDESSFETVTFSLDNEWRLRQAVAGNDVRLIRIMGESRITTYDLTCEAGIDVALCTAELEAHAGESAVYAITAVADKPQPAATPPPTPLAAPVDAPESTPLPGPLLVVVKDSTPVPAPLPTRSPVPQITPTPSPPDLPAAGGGTSVVTWLMSGVLGLVLIRGAFYAVGRIRS